MRGGGQGGRKPLGQERHAQPDGVTGDGWCLIGEGFNQT